MSKTMPLKLRILIGYLIPLSLLVAVSIAVYVSAQGLKRVNTSVDAAQTVVIVANDLVAEHQKMVAALRAYIITEDDHQRDAMQAAREQYDVNRKLLDQLVADPAQVQRLRRIDSARGLLMASNDKEVDLVAGGKATEAVAMVRSGRVTELSQSLEQEFHGFVDRERELLAQRSQEQADDVNQMVLLVVVATGLAVLLSIVSGAFVAARISRGISEAVAGMSTSTAQIAATVDEHERTISLQAAAVNETTSTVEELGASSRQSTEQAESTTAVARQALALATEGSRLAGQVEQSMADMQQQVGSVAEQIARLSDHAAQIGGIARMIGELAGETNMLALNAAVEAARAGEHGKGFAVVAAEVRKLAEQSKAAAERANGLVEDIQRATNSAVMVAEEGNRTAAEAAAITRRNVEAFGEIAGAANSVSVSTQQVLLNSRQQVIALSQVTDAMRSLAAASSQIATGSQQTQQGVQRLNEVAQGLQKML